MHINKQGNASFSWSEIKAGWWAYHGCPYCRSDMRTPPCKNCGAEEKSKLFFRKGDPIK